MKPIQLMTSLFSIGWLSLVLPSCVAFTPVSRPVNAQPLTSLKAIPTVEMPAAGAKSSFLNSLDPTIGLITPGSKPLTQQLTNIIESGNSLPNPGSQESFSKVANGVWRVVYAPHMTTMAGLARGKFSVEYELFEDGTIISHARYNFPLFNLYGYLSVSGTYGSVNDQVCRVDFNEAWIKQLGDGHSFEEGPYATIDSVPDSISKSIIRNAGRAAFIEPFAVFPVSYLDEDLIVFDFELLGTRICARRYHS